LSTTNPNTPFTTGTSHTETTPASITGITTSIITLAASPAAICVGLSALPLKPSLGSSDKGRRKRPERLARAPPEAAFGLVHGALAGIIKQWNWECCLGAARRQPEGASRACASAPFKALRRGIYIIPDAILPVVMMNNSGAGTLEKVAPNAARQTESSVRESLRFKELKGNTGATLHVARTNANYLKSQAILEKAGLEFFTRQEILLILTKDEVLKESLKGTWFYVAGIGLHTGLTLATIDEKGELIERKGKVSPEMTVRVWDGDNPLYVVVGSDGVAQVGGRFGVGACLVPVNAAPVVVGKAKAELKPEQLAEQLAKQAKTQLDGLLRLAYEAEKSVGVLKAGSKPELIEPIENLIRTVHHVKLSS
jgi:hypothetical protein